ncbi:MAG TPA: TonB-dependent receptor [Roseateles sp.]|uniref:TonB-dependent receptor n=1 Tax=Roseateles sp. TaxID=1971397 RepID=UPI002ED8CDC3
MTRKFNRAPLAAGLALCAISQAVMAQTPAPAAPSAAASAPEAGKPIINQLDVVIVSANKREERLQDVPATASVLQPQQLEQQRLVSMEDLQRAIPTLEGSGNGMKIRGYGATSFSPTAEGAVGIVVDGVSLGGASETPPNLFDVERVEVLEGSQGTLFGKNASAGIVNIVTVAPNPKKFGGAVRVEARTRKSGSAQAAVNVPLGEQLALRVVAGAVREPRIAHNLPDDTWDGIHRQNVRARLRWLPSSDVRVDLSVDNSLNENKGGNPVVFYKTTAGSPLTNALAACGVTASEENTDGCATEGYKRKDRSRGGSAQIDWFLNEYTLTSITALRKASSDTTSNELDGVNVPVPSAIQAPLFKTFKNTSQEFRVTSPDFDAGNFVAGAFYYDQDIEGGSMRKIVPPGLPPGLSLGDTKTQAANTRSVALFAQGIYRLNDEITFNMGARFGRENVSTVASGALIPGAVAAVIAANLRPVNAELADTYNSYKAGAQYQFTRNNMAYVLYTKGYKGPVVNDVLPTPTTSVIVRPEIPKTWELGLKNQFLNGRAGLNLTVYNTKATDFQTTVLDPATLSFVTGNAPSATFRGASVSFYGRVTPELLINGGLTRMKTETDRGGIGSTGGDPTIRGNLAATYSFAVAGMRASLGADVTYEDRPAEDPTAPLAWAHKATIFGAQAGLRSADDKWGVTLNVRNLFDKFDPAGRSGYFLGQFVGDTAAAFQTFKPETRRVVGLTLDAKF